MTNVHAGSEQIGGPPIRLEYRPYTAPLGIDKIFVGVKHIKRALLRCFSLVKRERRERSRFLHDGKVRAASRPRIVLVPI